MQIPLTAFFTTNTTRGPRFLLHLTPLHPMIFYSTRLYFVLLHSTLIQSPSFISSLLLHSKPTYSTLFYSTLLHPIPLHPTLFHANLSYSTHAGALKRLPRALIAQKHQRWAAAPGVSLSSRSACLFNVDEEVAPVCLSPLPRLGSDVPPRPSMFFT